jgi:hypothetical protein
MHALPLSDTDRKLFKKLYASAQDIRMARHCAEHIEKKQLYRPPYARGKIYLNQGTYVTALVVAYGRVFAGGRGGYGFPKRLMPYDADELALHERLLLLRNKIYAHSDLDIWQAEPWRVDGMRAAKISQPIYAIDEPDIARFLGMTEKLLARIKARESEILEPYEAAIPHEPGSRSSDEFKTFLEHLEPLKPLKRR